MDRLEAMSILLKVVDKGSFSGASRDLGVPLATVSRKVNELETTSGPSFCFAQPARWK
jgi:DNA-binding transcriptional LysR family regulator